MELTSVVLPTPGPPVMTSSLDFSAKANGVLLTGGQVDPQLALHPRDGLVGVRRRPGGPACAKALDLVGDRALGLVQRRQEDTGLLVHRVGHQDLVGDLLVNRALDDLAGDLQELDRQRHQFGVRQPAVPLGRRLCQGVRHAGLRTQGRVQRNADLLGDRVGRQEADAANVPREPVRVVLHHGDGFVAIGLEDPHRARGGHAVGVQEHHDLADDLLVGPAGRDLPGPLVADAVDLAQALGCLLDDVEDRRAEGADQPAGVDRADALDHAGAEVALDAAEGVRRRDLDEHGPELPAVLAVGDPVAGRRGVLAGGDTRGVTHERDQVAFAADLQPQHTEAAVGVVERDSLDEAGELFQRRQ